MAADLHIHVLDGASRADIAAFNRNTFGSKYFSPMAAGDMGFERAYLVISKTPNVWVGEVSWLSAAVSGDSETYVPPAVQAIAKLIGEDLPVIDENLIAKVEDAFKAENPTDYNVTAAAKVTDFLRQHLGKQAFTVSW